MKMLPPLRKRFCRSLTLLVLLLTEGLAATKGLMLSMSPQVLPPHAHTTLTRTLLRLRLRTERATGWAVELATKLLRRFHNHREGIYYGLLLVDTMIDGRRNTVTVIS